MTIYSPVIFLSQIWSNPFFYVQSNFASWPAYRFLRRQVRWSGIPISLRIFCSLLLWWWVFSCQVMPNSSQPHGLQHTRLPYPSPSPRVCPSSCSVHQWCHSTISSFVTLFSSCPQFFPAGSFPVSQLFTSDGQRASALAQSFQPVFRVNFL